MTDYIDFIDENGSEWTKTNRFREAKETIVAQAAVIQALVYALKFDGFTPDDPTHRRVQSEALAKATDSTQILDEVRRAEREKCAKVCEEQANEPECPERAMYCAAAIRAME